MINEHEIKRMQINGIVSSELYKIRIIRSCVSYISQQFLAFQIR